MIKVTRLNESQLWVNDDRIDFIEETPDTVISMTNGNKLVIRESAEEVVSIIIDFRVRIGERLLRGSGLPEYEKDPKKSARN